MSLPKPYYEHGGITIYHGDCREIVPQLGWFDLLLTDPPYGIGFAAQPTNYQRYAGMKPAEWDDAPASGALIHSAKSHCESQIIWGGNYFAMPPARCWLSWVKPDAPPSMGTVEYAWTNLDKNSKHLIQSISATNRERVGHPTQKPLRLMTWCLVFVPEAKTVLDPFMGSGTTLVAAKQRGIQAVGIDLSEKYCEIAASRLAQEILIAV